MNVVLFCHSLASCWNHGNAHFLRGVLRELKKRGHAVRVFEPEDGWSRQNLVTDHGDKALNGWRTAYPELDSATYAGEPGLDQALDGADLVLVHEWNPSSLVAALGRRRRQGGRFVLLFHDTHHRAVTDPQSISGVQLDGYDGVLAFGACLRERYLAAGWASRVWIWHEAADTSLFKPYAHAEVVADLAWIGNWGDGERVQELRVYLIEPVSALRLHATVHGVRYPASALAQLAKAGINFRGWLPNLAVPAAFARHRLTIHVPRRPYVEALPGIPTIRVFEALACGIPLISAPWRDVERLFPQGSFLLVRGGAAMTQAIRSVLIDASLRHELITTGLRAIRERHSCAHRVDELLAIHAEIANPQMPELRSCA